VRALSSDLDIRSSGVAVKVNLVWAAAEVEIARRDLTTQGLSAEMRQHDSATLLQMSNSCEVLVCPAAGAGSTPARLRTLCKQTDGLSAKAGHQSS
jgi:hypothetical protein